MGFNSDLKTLLISSIRNLNSQLVEPHQFDIQNQGMYLFVWTELEPNSTPCLVGVVSKALSIDKL